MPPQEEDAPIIRVFKMCGTRASSQPLPPAGSTLTGMAGVAAESHLLPAHIHACRNAWVQPTADWGRASIWPFCCKRI